MPYTYDYPRPMLTVDIFLLRLKHDRLEVLLIQRKNDPFKGRWALPGGYVEIEEPLEAAAKRELSEETGIKDIPLRKINVFGEPGRDPRGRTITIVYLGVVPLEFRERAKAGDDAIASQWYHINNLPDLAFDHTRIVTACYDNFRNNFLRKFWFLLFLENEFASELIRLLFSNVLELKLPIAEIQNILFNLPFVGQTKNKQTFLKNISNNDIIKLNDSVITDIWQNILTN